MSYILNALRKSEQERQEGHAETLESKIQHQQNTAPKKTSFWLILLVLVNLFFLSYFLWSFGTEQKEPNRTKIAASEQTQEIYVEPKKAEPALKVANKVIGSLSPAVEIPQPESLKQPARHSIAEQIKKQRKKAEPTVNRPKTKPKQRKETVTQKAKPSVQAQTPIKQHKVIAAETTASEKHDTDIPFLSELDYSFRRTVPNIDINVYVYAEKEQDRFIMIAMKKYQPGQQIDSDMTLKEIRINSLVIEYKNRAFQIKRK